MTARLPWGRFDDLTTGASLAFPSPGRVVVANRAVDVVPALAEVARATAAGGWAFGFVAYEAAAGLDPALVAHPRSADDPPLVWFGLCDRPPVEPAPLPADAAGTSARWRLDWSDDEHRRAVERVRDHIAAGDTYQCNLTDRLRAAHVGDPLALYARLARAQQGSFNAYLDTGRHVVASASPELFLDWTGDRVTTRPMKGTAARGRTAADDVAAARGLRESAKEQAENLMIVDLLRNDLSRVAVTGTVAVPALFTVERYPTVWQLTSEVAARVRDDVTLVDLFGALFPCGSVTGAPKARTMRLIRDLESGPRGVYCGAIGMVAPPGQPFRARFSVAIRTVVVDRDTDTAVYGTGGGITWSSVPADERAELTTKAAVLTGVRPLAPVVAPETAIRCGDVPRPGCAVGEPVAQEHGALRTRYRRFEEGDVRGHRATV